MIVALQADANLLISHFHYLHDARVIRTPNRVARTYALPPALLIISSATFFGAASYESNCIVYEARPCVVERRWVA